MRTGVPTTAAAPPICAWFSTLVTLPTVSAAKAADDESAITRVTTAGMTNLNVDSPLNLRRLGRSTHHQAITASWQPKRNGRRNPFDAKLTRSFVQTSLSKIA